MWLETAALFDLIGGYGSKNRTIKSAFGDWFSFFLIEVNVVAKASRTKKINAMYKYIWSLKDRCDSISEINKDLVGQYCRFTVMANEMAEEIQKMLGKDEPEKVMGYIALYEKFQKISVTLYKTLKFDSIKDELKDQKNPFLELAQEAARNGSL